MVKSNFWNEACKYGAIIGLAMSVAYIIEQSFMLSGKLPLMMAMALVWVIASVGYIVMLYYFTKRRRAACAPEEGFSFGQGFGFLIAMVLLAALIKGVIEFLYRSVLIGYSEYMDRYINAMTQAISGGGVPASMEGFYAQTFEQMQSMPEPSILATVWSAIFGNLLVGGLLSLILAAVLARAPRPFGPQSEE